MREYVFSKIADFQLLNLFQLEFLYGSFQGFCPDVQNTYFSENLFCDWLTLTGFALLKKLLKVNVNKVIIIIIMKL